MSFDDVEEEILKDDPLRLMKHLDAFINDDGGYGWNDSKLMTKKELVKIIKTTLTKE